MVLRPFFFRIGKKVHIDLSCDFKNIKYLSLGNRVIFDQDFWIMCIPNNSSELEKRKRGPCIIIDDGVVFGRRLVLSAAHQIHIHKNVLFAPNVYVSDHSHSYTKIDVPIKNQGICDINAVEIGENGWIGINVVILPGTKIGKNCVIGANSVVKGIFPDNVIIAGAPAKIIKKYGKRKWIRIN
ncbi:MAG: acyltransferase [Candidatus Nanoarchaeia archaeon]|nr:acyltransferase [Candidatus Nanoarchaeia archaeon]